MRSSSSCLVFKLITKIGESQSNNGYDSVFSSYAICKHPIVLLTIKTKEKKKKKKLNARNVITFF